MFEIEKQLTPKNGIIFLIVLIVVGGIYIINWSQVSTETATIVDMSTIHDIKNKKTSYGFSKKTTKERHLIRTDKGIFEDTGDLLRGKLSTQYYFTLKDGETYIFTVAGLSIPFINVYPNVIDLKPVINTTSSQIKTEY